MGNPIVAPGLPLFVACGDDGFNLQCCYKVTIEELGTGPGMRYIPQFWSSLYNGTHTFRPWKWGFETEREAKKAVDDLFTRLGLPPMYDSPPTKAGTSYETKEKRNEKGIYDGV